MMPPYYQRLASDWAEYFDGLGSGFDVNETLNPYPIFEMVIRYEPFWAIELLLETINLSNSKNALETLIDGPLSEFVNSFGHIYFDDIAESIRNNEIFREAMKGVIKLDIDDVTWFQIQDMIDSN